MHFRTFAAAAVLSLSAMALAPTSAWAQSGAVEFHIEATSSVAPDRAVVPLTLTSTAETEEKAKADLDKAEKLVRKKLAGQGIKPTQISLVSQEAGSEGEITVETNSSCAAAAAIDASDDAAAVAYAAGQDAADEAARAAGGERAPDDCNVAYFVGRRSLKIELSDISKLEAISTNAASDGYQIGKIAFSQSDPAAAHRKARAEAIAKAHADADGMAEAMGYRITGITRVSNTKPSLSLPGLIEFLASVEGRGQSAQPSWFTGSVSESVMINFVAVPK